LSLANWPLRSSALTGDHSCPMPRRMRRSASHSATAIAGIATATAMSASTPIPSDLAAFAR